MAGILNIAASSLNAFQRALAVTGNNIANSSNRAYTRQTVQFAPMPSQRYAGSYIGGGVAISNIQRNSDRFATEQVRETLTTKSQYDSLYQQAIQIDKLLSEKGTSLSGNMQTFFTALGQLNETPDNLASRSLMLQQSQLLVDQFNSLQLRFDEYQRNNTTQITEAVNQINQITANIAQINKQLTAAPDAPELLDTRDDLLRELAKYTEVTVIDQGNAGIDVAIGNGEMLVIGAEQRNLVVNANLTGQLGTQVFLANGQGQIDITSNLHSGMIGGLLEFEQDILGYGSQLIGQLAIGLATAFNTQHKLGIDMNSQIGKNYFTDYNQANLQLSRSLPSNSNTGAAVLSVAISDINQTMLSDYQLVVSDTATNEVRLIRQSDGQSTTLNWTNTPPAPPAGQIILDGMTITVDDVSNLVNSDRFTLMPTRGAARDLQLNITDPREIALASPVRTEASINNTGSGRIALGDVLNTNAAVGKEYSIQFISPTQYNLINVTDSVTTGPFTFTPNTDNTIMIPDSVNPSYSVILSGIPATGDTFSASYNAGGIGDNRNGLMLAALQQSKIFNNGTASLFDKHTDLITGVGGVTYQAKIRSDAAEILHQQAVDFRESKSGVNLDEEASNLLRFEQAYQAASRVMAVSSQIMDALFAVMR
ncbi:flagellar hook-associated protein FlgK [Legionella micdadei]|uniref:Flagellar hook-associated protein 1 n=2 Tax=Pseudomonadota TaxID=1224 RepID=A0A098GF70_LEGMI|nr:flagellar hook-associated protein FlgK [Legionella micdadei]ARG97784.1 flagellar hook-associated protein FlgK [Legionella micdadei]ARG99899.1 flagellar hook-associated protein FlgK [Legionella micdadei]KTD28495.1 flagellar hook-associated protein FlgK [Legionella micdadei]NSL18736.1 flagellar hook-associated protein FlgK [Legionella micdadei]CEG60615.1 Flagellar hook-associated protein 1 [Legionella micdadei]